MASKKGAIPKLQSEPFRRSPKTPPKNKKSKPQTEESNKADTSVYLCQICGTEDDLEKIHCDGCTLWYHFACAHVSKDVLQQDSWLCGTCKAKKAAAEVPVGNLVNVGTEKPSEVLPVNVIAKLAETSKGSHSDTSSVSQRTIRASIPANSQGHVHTENPSGRTSVPPTTTPM